MSVPHPQSRSAERLLLLTLAAIQFTHILDYMIMMPLGSHLMRVFGIDPAQFSYLVAAYSLAAAGTGFLAGFVVDRFDRKRTLLFLYAGFSLSTLGCALAPGYHSLLAMRFLAGAFGGVASSIVVAAVGDVVPAERRGAAMGIVMTAFPLASVLGVPVGLLLGTYFEWHAPFFLLGAVSIAICLVGIRILPALPRHHELAHPWQQMSEILAHPVHRRGFMLSAVLVFAGGCVIPFMAPSMVTNVGLTERQLPLVYLAGGACTFFTTPWFGRLTDRFDKLHVLAWISFAASVAVLVLTNLPPVPVLTALVVTSFFMVTLSGRFTPAMTMISNAVDNRYRGGFMSVNSAVQQAASALANTIAGFFIILSPTGTLVGFGRVGLLSVVAFALTVFLAARLRELAPHSARPGLPLPVPVAD